MPEQPRHWGNKNISGLGIDPTPDELGDDPSWFEGGTPFTAEVELNEHNVGPFTVDAGNAHQILESFGEPIDG